MPRSYPRNVPLGKRWRVPSFADQERVNRALRQKVSTPTWLTAAQAAGYVAFADFNNDRYALPTIDVANIATATLPELSSLRIVTRDEWFAQFTGPVGRSYYDATAVLRANLAANAPRFDYTNGKRQLLLEPAATNLFINSESATTFGAINLTAVNNAAPGPYGTTTAGTFRETTANADHYTERAIVQACNVPLTVSQYVRGVGRSVVIMKLYGNAYADSITATFNLDTGVITSTGGAGTGVFSDAKMKKFGDMWRISLSGTPSSAVVTNLRVRLQTVAGSTTYVGDISKGMDVFGPQVETGLIATSYIPTAGSTVTRSVESFRLPLAVEAVLKRASNAVILKGQNMRQEGGHLLGSSAASLASLLRANSPARNLVVTEGGVAGLATVTPVINFDTSFAVATSQDATGRAAVANNGTVATNASARVAQTAYYLGRSSVTGSYGLGHYDFIGIMGSRPTNAKLSELATPVGPIEVVVVPPTPVNTLAPQFNSIKARNPVVGDIIFSTDIADGEYTVPGSTLAKSIEVNGVAKTLPYTVVVGDVGLTIRPKEVPTAAGVTGAATLGTATQAVLPSPGANALYLTHITDITAARNEGTNKYIRYNGRNFAWDSDWETWSLSTTDNKYLRFETRPGDVMDAPHPFPDTAGTERNRLVTASPWRSPNDDFIWEGSFIIDQGFDTGGFNTFLESHTYGTGAGSPNAKQFEFAIDNTGKLWVLANHSPTSGNSVARSMWVSATNFVLGKEYFYKIYMKVNPDASASQANKGRLRVVLDDVELFNFIGQTGHHLQTEYNLQYGHYRGGTPSPSTTGVIRHAWTRMDFGAFGTLTDPNPPALPPGEVLGAELAGARQPITSATGITGGSATVAYNSGTGYLEVTNTIISGNTHGKIAVPTTAGKRYKAVLTGKRDTADGFYVSIYDWGDAFAASAVSTSTTDASVEVYWDALGASCDIFMQNQSFTAGKKASFKSISVKEVIS